MPSAKKILIFDDEGFSKVCSAMLSEDGYQIELALSQKEAIRSISQDDIALIISGYPYGMPLLKSHTPTL